MKYLKKKVNSFLSSAKEFSNREEIHRNDNVASKYFDLIYKDWDLNKDVFRSKIADSDGYTDFWYKISDSPNGHVNTKPDWGNRGKDELEIKLTLIKEGIMSDWCYDISRARIEVDKFIPYKGGLNLFGREMKTNKLLVDENGIERDDIYPYINISPKKVEDIIKFFKENYIAKYPKLKRSKYFNSFVEDGRNPIVDI